MCHAAVPQGARLAAGQVSIDVRAGDLRTVKWVIKPFRRAAPQTRSARPRCVQRGQEGFDLFQGSALRLLAAMGFLGR
jgi:hypothetical protein